MEAVSDLLYTGGKKGSFTGSILLFMRSADQADQTLDKRIIKGDGKGVSSGSGNIEGRHIWQ